MDNFDESEDFQYGELENESKDGKTDEIALVAYGLEYDTSTFYCAEDQEEIKEVLDGLGFRILADKFNEELIDMDALRNMSQIDVRDLLKGYPIGLRIKFYKALVEWQRLDKQSSVLNSLQMADSDNLQNKLIVANQAVKSILSDTEEGKQFMKKAQQTLAENQTFTLKLKRELAEILCAYYLDQKISLSKYDLKHLASQIPTIFSSEMSKEYFLEDKNKVSGFLYSKYYNLRPKFIQSEPKTKKRKLDKENAVEEVEATFNSTEIDSDTFVQTNSQDSFDALLSHWRNSSKIRTHFIKQSQGSLKVILSKYKSFTRDDGYVFVNFDFTANFNTPGNFSDTLEALLPKVAQYLVKNLSNKSAKEILSNFASLDMTRKVSSVLYGLHVHLYTGGGRYKSTIHDAMQQMLFISPNEASSELNQRQQPVILAFGKIDDLRNPFLVSFDNSIYKFNALDKALESLLKIYATFSLDFPSSNQLVFQFLMKTLLNIDYQSVNPKLISIYNALK